MRKTLKKVTDVELQSAWDVVADYMNQHHELSFFIDPWSGTSGMMQRYELHYYDSNDKKIKIVSSSRSWKK